MLAGLVRPTSRGLNPAYPDAYNRDVLGRLAQSFSRVTDVERELSKGALGSKPIEPAERTERLYHPDLICKW